LRAESFIAGIGLGSAGCKILASVSKRCEWLKKSIYISLEEKDFPLGFNGNKLLLEYKGILRPPPLKIRAIMKKNENWLKNRLKDADSAFIFVGLGGKVGSALAPIVSDIAKNLGLEVFCIIVMPFSSQKSKHFRAGVSLRQIRRICDGVLVIDNDELIDMFPDLPLTDAYEKVNSTVAEAIRKMTDMSKDGIGIAKFAEAINGFAVLSISQDKDLYGLASALEANWRLKGKTERASILVNGRISVADFEHIRRILQKAPISAEKVNVGISGSSSSLSAILITSGKIVTKFDSYDPLAMIENMEKDCKYDCAVDLEFDKIIPFDQ
jgi:cell division protein FtsZ